MEGSPSRAVDNYLDDGTVRSSNEPWRQGIGVTPAPAKRIGACASDDALYHVALRIGVVLDVPAINQTTRRSNRYIRLKST
jgi:hypothetical protein